MKPKILLCLALVLAGLVLVSSLADAQPGGGFTYQSIEARIVEAPLVIRGTFTDLTAKTPPTQGNFIVTNYVLTVRVDEILKGSLKDKVLEFTFPSWKEFEESVARRASFLWFLDSSGKLLKVDYPDWQNVIPLGPTLPGGEWDALSKGMEGMPVYGMDMTVLTRREDILSRARAFARKRMHAAKFHSVFLPQQSSSDHYFFPCELVVPVESSLEITAKHLIAKPDDFIGANHESNLVPQWRCDYQADGVSALQYFKSAANIKLLKSLLIAPDYPLREASYEVLRGWSVDAPKPLTEETVPAREAKP